MRRQDIEHQAHFQDFSLRDRVSIALDSAGISANEKLGQHFLVDQKIVDLIAQEAQPDTVVIEVGAGVGQLTEALAQRANSVVSYEIDRRFSPILDALQEKTDNLEIVYADVLGANLAKTVRKAKGEAQIIANLPYHITEPFMHLASSLGVPMTLMVGRNFSEAVSISDPESLRFTTLTMLAQAFFEIYHVTEVPRESFDPEPRTESDVIRFVPKGEARYLSREDFLVQQLFLTQHKSPPVINVLKEAIIKHDEESSYGTKDKKETRRQSRRAVKQELRQLLSHLQNGAISDMEEVDTGSVMSQSKALEIIHRMQIPDQILNKPFSRLNNSEVRVLANCLSQKTR